MKYPLFYISVILWLLVSCSGNVSPIPLNCNCPLIHQVIVDSINAYSFSAKWENKWNVYEYELKITDIQNNEDSIYTVYDVSGIYPTVLSKNISGLSPGSLYQITIRSVCGKPYHCQYGDWSEPTFVVTDNSGNCAQPVNFAVFDVKQDTLTMAWQNSPNISNYLLSITDSSGNLVLHQNYTDFSPASSPVRFALIDSNLPDGDYTIWIQSDCGSELSLPSNIGVFTVRNSGGGPVVVIDDNIDIYAPINCPTCAVNFPPNYSTTDILSPRSMTFANRNTPPQQVLMGYAVENNSNLSCAPTAANLWRIKSLKVHAPYFNMPNNEYRISLPAIKCVCAGEKYAVRVVARDIFAPFSGGTMQTCN